MPFARFTSRFSCSSALIFAASSLDRPGFSPASISDRLRIGWRTPDLRGSASAARRWRHRGRTGTGCQPPATSCRSGRLPRRLQSSRPRPGPATAAWGLPRASEREAPLRPPRRHGWDLGTEATRTSRASRPLGLRRTRRPSTRPRRAATARLRYVDTTDRRTSVLPSRPQTTLRTYGTTLKGHHTGSASGPRPG